MMRRISGSDKQWARARAVVVVAMAAFWPVLSGTAQVVTGVSGKADNHSTVNMRGLMRMQGQFPTPSVTNRAYHLTMPVAGQSGPEGDNGGGGAANAGGADAMFAPAAAPQAPSPSPSVTFSAVDDNLTQLFPDTHGAVGPDHVMTTVASQVRIQDRAGNVLSTVDLNAFWQSVGGSAAFNPKLLYDPYGERWIFTAGSAAVTPNSSILLGVSQTTDPTGNWFLYRVKADRNNISYADHLNIGFNKDWIVVSATMFPIVNTNAVGFDGVNLFVFNKTNVYANGTGTFTLLRDGSTFGFALCPTVTYDRELPVMHLVEVDNLFYNFTTTSKRLRLSTITGQVGAETLALGTAFTGATNEWASSEPLNFFGGLAPQLNSFFNIFNWDSRIQGVVYRNGNLWLSHTVFLPATLPTHTAVQWWQINTNGATLQFGRIEDPVGITHYAAPSIAVNRNEDVLVGFSRFSLFQFPSANYAFRSCLDEPSTMRSDVVLKDGEAPYAPFGGLLFINPWSPYSATVVDPINDSYLWTIQEYGLSPTNIGGFPQDRWGTWWGQVRPTETCFRIDFLSSFYNVNEATPGLATIRVLNLGGAAGTVDFATSDGTAVAGVDYLPRTGTLTFSAGQFETNFTIVILDNAVVNSNKTINLSLLNPSGPAELGRITNAVLTIEDDETAAIETRAGEFVFSSYLNDGVFYYASEFESITAPCGNELYTIVGGPERDVRGALITVVRTNGIRGRVMVDYATLEGGTAIPFTDYTPVSGTLVFDDYQTSTNFSVEVFPNFFIPLVPTIGLRFIRVGLSNPRAFPEEDQQLPGTVRPKLGLGSESQILVYDVWRDPLLRTNLFSFEKHEWRVDEYASPTVQGGYRIVNIQVINPPGASGRAESGRVRVRTRQYPNNSEYLFTPNVLIAGSDFAEAPEPDTTGIPPFSRTVVWPNPPIFDPGLTTITNYADYQKTNFVLEFRDRQCRANVTILITNDVITEFNEDIMLVLDPIDGERGVNIYGADANLTILADEQPAGALDREWNPANLPSSDPPLNQTPGANYPVRAIVVQPDGRSVIGGDFDHVNAVRRPGVARMNADGSLDRLFDPGIGADAFVAALQLYPVGSPNETKILVGGGFSSFNGIQRNGIVRLLGNGAIDPTFFPGTGADGAVWSIALQADGRIVVAGSFRNFNDFPRNGIARLNDDGSLDLTFDPGNGAVGTIYSIGLTPDPAGGSEKIYAGGDFNTFAGENAGGIVKLNADGSIDSNFQSGGGVLGFVNAIAVQANGAVVLGGYFSEVDGVRRINVARLNSDGSLDPNFDPGFGPDGQIMALALQPDGKALVGGPFTTFNGTRRLGFTRLRLDGTVDTSFLDTAYNQFAGFPTTYSFEPANYAAAFAIQPDGNIMVGGSFTNVGGNPSYRAPLRNRYTVFTRSDKQVRYNIARVIGGATPGPGNAEFESSEYFVDENGNVASIQLQRADGRLGTLSAVAQATNGVAISGLDFVSTNLPNRWPEAYLTPSFLDPFRPNAPVNVGRVSDVFMRVPLLDDTLLEGDETVNLSFVRPEASITLGGDLIPLGGALGRARATLNIGDNDVKRGTFAFGTTQFFTNETAIEAVISVIRTNGSLGAVSVNYFTRNSTNTPIATPNVDYRPISGTLFFASGQTNRDFRVRLIDDEIVEFDENIELVLTNATGGARLPGGQPTSVHLANLAIIDNDFSYGRLNFALTSYTTNEDAGFATIAVTRSGGSLGQVSVQYTTANGTAIAPGDYTATTGTLTWDDGDTSIKSFDVPLVMDGVVDNNLTRFETVALRLLNPRIGTVSNSQLLGSRTNAVLNIEDSDSYGVLAFSQPIYQADENGASAVITVTRRFGLAGVVSVDFTTAPVDPLSPGTDYTPVTATLTFQPGESSKNVAIPLLDETEPDGNKDVILTLSNPVLATLGTPNPATLTIVDNESFNITAGELDTLFTADAKINGPVYSLALQPDGRLLAAGDFTEVNNVSRASVARLESDGRLETSFSPDLGPNAAIRSIALQSDGKLMVGGLFSQFNGTNRNGIVRLNADGGVDAFFNPGAGANNPVYVVALTPDERVLVGGSFSTFNSITRPGVVRLNTNGTVDTTFNPGSGANNTVYALAQQSDGKLLVGGEFTQFNGQPKVRIARLNRNGSIDTSFNASFNSAVRAIVIQSDGRIIVGGSFTTANNVLRNYLARLNSDGTLDTTFLAGGLTGGDGPVFALALQVDEKVMVAGDFTQFNSVTRNRLTRLNTDGSNDSSINFGAGADGFITAMVIQPDRKIVIGGGFTKYNDQPRLRIARIFGGSIGGAVTGAGAIEFSRAEFVVTENSTNAAITARRRYGTAGTVTVDYRTVDGTALAGVHYEATAGTLVFPAGETQARFFVPIIDNQTTNADLRLTLELLDNSYTGGATNGLQPIARLLILDDEGSISFDQPDYVVGENVASGVLPIRVIRHGGTNFGASVNFFTANGTATAGADYFATNGVITFLPGEVSKLFHVRIINDANVEQNEVLTVNLSNPSVANVLGISSAPLVILEDDFAAGQFVLSSASYSVVEGAGNAMVTVLRTNGSSGVASIRYRTADNTAQNGVDYVGTNAILAFADGEVAKTVQVAVLDDLLVEPLETFSIVLFGASGGPSVGSISNAFVTITDNDISVITNAGSALVAESFVPANGVIDPGETVTVALGLQNRGSGNTGNLIATLLTGNGVTAPSGPQTYGVLVANGPAVSQNFSFTAVGNSGDRVIATLRLVDGGATNGFVAFPFTLSGQASRSLSNTNRITINDNTTASPYPSTIEVLNLGGQITSVTVTISNLTHTFPDDIDILLVSPQGQKVTLLSDAGGNIPVSNITMTFSPTATDVPPDAGPLVTRAYLPTNYAGLGTADLFPSPAPGIPYTNSFLSSFNGTDPNGVWALYIVDDNAQDQGSIGGGWRLSIQTSDPVSPAADIALAASAPNPVAMGAEFLCTLTVTNRGPSTAHNVTLLDQMPPGLSMVRATTSTGSFSVIGGTMTWNIGTIPQGSSATVSIVARADTVGTLVNQVQVGASQVDLRPIDNSATMQTTVVGVPALAVFALGNTVRITWPGLEGFILQSSDSPSGAGWTNVNVAPQVIGSQKVVDLPLQGTGRFYRLRSQ